MSLRSGFGGLFEVSDVVILRATIKWVWDLKRVFVGDTLSINCDLQDALISRVY